MHLDIRISDANVIKHIKTLLKQMKGVESVTVRKNEVQLSLDDAHRGNVTTWNSVDDYFN